MLTLPERSEFAVVLVEPRIPQNVGSIARLCACTGTPLWLVGELGFVRHDRHLKRTGMDYMDRVDLRHVPDWTDILGVYPDWSAVFLTTHSSNSLFSTRFLPRSLLVFGREDRGLPKDFIEANATHTVRIPMTAAERSLNLASSVAIILMDALRQTYAPEC